jgi:hypothetical protein
MKKKTMENDALACSRLRTGQMETGRAPPTKREAGDLGEIRRRGRWLPVRARLIKV